MTFAYACSSACDEDDLGVSYCAQFRRSEMTFPLTEKISSSLNDRSDMVAWWIEDDHSRVERGRLIIMTVGDGPVEVEPERRCPKTDEMPEFAEYPVHCPHHVPRCGATFVMLPLSHYRVANNVKSGPTADMTSSVQEVATTREMMASSGVLILH